MDDVRQRVTDFIRALPAAHRVVIVAAVLGVALGAGAFFKWVTTPSYTVLYAGLDDAGVSDVIDELETAGVPYKLGAGGSSILVPREQLYTTRASLASAGISGETVPAGYELLDSGGLSVSDFRQRVDYQRALEGELAKTLLAMDGINAATVHLVMPERELFTEEQQPVTASVLVDPARPLGPEEIETITFLVASSVEGLDTGSITVADAAGTVLHAPGDVAGASVATNRNLRATQEFERALAADVEGLLERVGGGPASVVVRAELNFDEVAQETEDYAPESAVALRSQETAETFSGTGATQPLGAVGVDGGPLPIAGEGSTSDYERTDRVDEFAIDKTSSRRISAPGRVEKLSVAIVVDDGSLTGTGVPPTAEVEALVAAALGLEPERGDSIAVQAVPFPAVVEDAEQAPPATDMVGIASQVVAVLVLLLVSLALFLMTRRRKPKPPEVTWQQPVDLPVTPIEVDDEDDELVIPEPEPVVRREAPLVAASIGVGSDLQREVTEMVERQPEEIAALLRTWLADRRA